MAPVRVARAFRYSIIAAMTALALSGCMRRSAPVAVAQPRSDLDSLAYGQPSNAAPRSLYMSSAGVAASGGAIGALRSGFAASPRRAYTPAPAAYAAPMPVAYDRTYRLDAGDRLRIVVYGQEGLTNTYAIDAGGSITMPLIGAVRARGLTPAGLADEIAGKLRNGYIREPSVAVEIEAYRPFFILGEVAAPGQYPYVPNMSVESAVAIAGGFSPRAKRDRVTLTHTDASGSVRAVVPLGTPISPGDTVLVGERWF
jgi:polysaccharide export outer membrane protein